MKIQSNVFFVIIVLLYTATLTSAAPPAKGLTFQGLGFLSGGGPDSYAYAVSTDGQVVGESRSVTGSLQAFRWTVEEGMTCLGDLPGGGDRSYAHAVSADGSVVVGGSSGEFPTGGNDIQPFRWTSADGMISLGSLSPGGGGIAYDVSADGATIVGFVNDMIEWPVLPKAFKWTESEGLMPLGDLLGGDFRSEAYGISADGMVVAGESNSELAGDGHYDRESCIWTLPDGIVGLGDLPNGRDRNYARAISADGSVVVGDAFTPTERNAYYWTAQEGMVALGLLPDGTFARYAYAVSADGSVIIGEAAYAKAFIWDKENGTRFLQEVLENEHGLELTGWKLRRATGVSDDGKTIVGFGINPNGEYEAWIVTPIKPNSVPVADAGDDITACACIDSIAEVKLDGSDSYDEDGDELTYLWSWIVDSNEITATGVDPNVLLPIGEHTIELIVNDGLVDSEPNAVIITVIAPVEADVHIVPRTINRQNRMKRIMAIIRLPEDVNRHDIVDEPFVLEPGGIEASWQRVFGSRRRCMVFMSFDKDEVMDALTDTGRAELTITGRLTSGQCIYGRDKIRIVQPLRQRWRSRFRH